MQVIKELETAISISLYLSVLQDSIAYNALSARLFALLLLVHEIYFHEYGKGITSEKYQTIDRRHERIERDVHSIMGIYVCLQRGGTQRYGIDDTEVCRLAVSKEISSIN